MRRSLEPRLLSPAQAAYYLGIPLRDFRSLGLPRCVLVGHELYDRQALDAWVDRLSGTLPPDDPEAALDRFIAANPGVFGDPTTTVPQTAVFRRKTKA